MKKVQEKERVVPDLDLSVVRKEHVGKWVALSTDYRRLLAVGTTLADVLGETSVLQHKVVLKVLPNLGYAPEGMDIG